MQITNYCHTCHIRLTYKYANVDGITILESFTEFKSNYICEKCINELKEYYNIIKTKSGKFKELKTKQMGWKKGLIEKLTDCDDD